MTATPITAPVRTARFGPVHRLDAGGSSTAYWTLGPADAANTVIAVHGFRGDHHGLGPIAAHLADGCRVVVPDLPGFGASTPLVHDHDLEGFTAWLAEFLAQIDITGSLTLLGHSFGSIVAATTLAWHDTPVDRLVLINPIASPALAGPRTVLTAAALGYYRLSAALPASAGRALLSHRAIVRAMSMMMAHTRDRQLRRWIHDQHRRYFSVFADRTSLLQAFQTSVSHTVADVAAEIACPTLLIAGESDEIAPLGAQIKLQPLFADARLRRIRGVGHLIHYEAPDVAARHVAEFLDRRDATTPAAR